MEQMVKTEAKWRIWKGTKNWTSGISGDMDENELQDMRIVEVEDDERGLVVIGW